MAEIEFRLGTESLGVGEVTTVTPYVGGVSLVELARRVEARPATAAREPNLAGAYAGLVVGAGDRWQDWYSGADPQVCGDGDSCLLGCTCGDTGCWPLTATIAIGADRVTWSGFRTGHRPWNLDSLGPFVFSRAAYDRALAHPA